MEWSVVFLFCWYGLSNYLWGNNLFWLLLGIREGLDIVSIWSSGVLHDQRFMCEPKMEVYQPDLKSFSKKERWQKINQTLLEMISNCQFTIFTHNQQDNGHSCEVKHKTHQASDTQRHMLSTEAQANTNSLVTMCVYWPDKRPAVTSDKKAYWYLKHVALIHT